VKIVAKEFDKNQHIAKKRFFKKYFELFIIERIDRWGLKWPSPRIATPE